MPPGAEVQELVELARAVGGDLLLVQGGGGNVSVKSRDGARMWIKVSGVRLAEVSATHGHVETDLAALVAAIRDPALGALPRREAHEASVRRIQRTTRGAGGLRPSLETGFHAVLPRVVLHTHPVYANAFLCMDGGPAAFAAALPDIVATVPYAPPGHALAVAVDQAWRAAPRRGHGGVALVALESHGLIAAGDSVADVVAATDRAVEAGRTHFGPLEPGALRVASPPAALVRWADDLGQAARARTGQSFTARATRFAALLDAAREPNRWLCAGPLVPDDVVYSGPRVLVADVGRPANVWLAALPAVPGPMVVAVPDLGVVFGGRSDMAIAAAEETLLAHVLIRQLIARRGQPRVLPALEVDYLAAMESEHYRAVMVAGAPGPAVATPGAAAIAPEGTEPCRS